MNAVVVRAMGWSLGGLLLLAPLTAMQFTDEVKWTGMDFAFAAALVLGAGIPLELAVRKSSSTAYRCGAALALLGAFLLAWLGGAVGIIGPETEPANRMFVVVLASGFAGAWVARFEARGLARAMLLPAGVQALIGLVAVTGHLGASDPLWPWDVVGLTAFFCGLWLASARLFSRAAAGAA